MTVCWTGNAKMLTAIFWIWQNRFDWRTGTFMIDCWRNVGHARLKHCQISSNSLVLPMYTNLQCGMRQSPSSRNVWSLKCVLSGCFLPKMNFFFDRQVRLYEAYGIHPRYLGDDPHNDLLRLRDLVQTRPVVAIGECGLDLLNNEQLSLQTEIFSAQTELANEFHLPLIIHCRQLDQQLLDILKHSALDSSKKIQWHCCHSKGAAVYREFLAYFPSSVLSIGGMCCHSGEKNLQRLIRELFESERSDEQRRFVFETDSPYLKSSSLLTRSEENCPILGTLASSAYVTRTVLKSNQWSASLKINTNVLQEFFHLT